jgi:hypothetical protein
VPGFLVPGIEAGAAGVAFGGEEEAGAGGDYGDGEDIPGVLGDDVGGQEIHFAGGVGDGASVGAAVGAAVVAVTADGEDVEMLGMGEGGRSKFQGFRVSKFQSEHMGCDESRGRFL